MSTPFAKRLSNLLADRKMSQTDLANLSGIRQSSISDYINGKYEPKQDKVDAIARALNVSPGFLIGLNQSQISPPPRFADLETESILQNIHKLNYEGRQKVRMYSDDLVESGKYKVSEPTLFTVEDYTEAYTIGAAAAGSGFAYGDPDEQHRLFMTTELPKHDFSIDVVGDSMFPTIVDGDVVFVKKDCYQQDGKIYVLDIDGETVVKRVYFTPDEITLVSDNPEWDDRIVTGAELERTRVLGEVIGWETPIK